MNAIERAIEAVSPRWAAKRAFYRRKWGQSLFIRPPLGAFAVGFPAHAIAAPRPGP